MDDITAAGDALDSEDSDVSYEHSIDLDWAQITYALNAKHLLFITNPKMWVDFRNECLNNSHVYMDLTAEQLSERFLNHVLPNIYDYDLSEQEEYLLSLLDLHPDFDRTEQGFILSKEIKKLYFPDKATIQPLLASETLKETGFKAEGVHLNKQIIITDLSQQTVASQFIFEEENANLLSIVFSSDEDLPYSQMLTTEEIYKRFKSAKNNFELKGQLPSGLNLTVNDLLRKLKTMCELKTAISKLLQNLP